MTGCLPGLPVFVEEQETLYRDVLHNKKKLAFKVYLHICLAVNSGALSAVTEVGAGSAKWRWYNLFRFYSRKQ